MCLVSDDGGHDLLVGLTRDAVGGGDFLALPALAGTQRGAFIAGVLRSLGLIAELREAHARECGIGREFFPRIGNDLGLLGRNTGFSSRKANGESRAGLPVSRATSSGEIGRASC